MPFTQLNIPLSLITRHIYPYWLRERLSARLQKYLPPVRFESPVSLAFAPGVSMHLCDTDIGHRALFANGFYELALTRRLRKLARNGGLMLDAGANYGYFSLLWLANNPANRCIAFEASPLNVPPLTENLHRNGFSKRVSIESCALSDREGTVGFALHDQDGQTGWGGIAPASAADTIRVPAITLDRFWQKLDLAVDIAVLKIDVEGADTLVLRGAESLLRSKRIRHIFFEVNPLRMQLLGIPENQAADLLNTHGYRLEQVDTFEMHAFL